MSRRVAIIGGGAAAATMLIELLERPSRQPLHLDWYTGGGAPGRGVAYQSPSPRHLLNVRAASMSMFTGKPHGFLEFLQRDDPQTLGTDFVPRYRYGDYLEAEISRSLEQGRAHGHDVNLVPLAVDALVPERDGVTVMHGEESHEADAAVLALGALAPQPLAGVSAQALASGRYVVDPWRLLAGAGRHRGPAPGGPDRTGPDHRGHRAGTRGALATGPSSSPSRVMGRCPKRIGCARPRRPATAPNWSPPCTTPRRSHAGCGCCARRPRRKATGAH